MKELRRVSIAGVMIPSLSCFRPVWGVRSNPDKIIEMNLMEKFLFRAISTFIEVVHDSVY